MICKQIMKATKKAARQKPILIINSIWVFSLNIQLFSKKVLAVFCQFFYNSFKIHAIKKAAILCLSRDAANSKRTSGGGNSLFFTYLAPVLICHLKPCVFKPRRSFKQLWQKVAESGSFNKIF